MARMTSWQDWTGTPRGLLLSSALAFAVGVATAVHMSPSPTRRYTSEIPESPLQREARRAKEYYERAWTGARAVQMRDSLRALARPGLTIRLDPRLSRDQAAQFEQRLRASWAPFSVTTTRVPVIVALTAAPIRSAALPFDDPVFVSLPTAPGEPCVAALRVLGTWRTVERDARAMRQNLFGCALMAQHGYPGAAVQGELRRIGWSPSPLRFQRNYYYFSMSGTTLGAAGPWSSVDVIPHLACNAGKRDGCASIATRRMYRSREWPAGMARGTRFFSDLSLIALLKASLKPAEFERLWHDDRPFPVAVAAITGRPVDDWTRQALLRTAPSLQSAFSPTLPLVGRALLFLLIAVAASVALQTRRRVS